MEEEFRLRLEQRTADLMAEGPSPAEARAEALRRFGDLDRATR